MRYAFLLLVVPWSLSAGSAADDLAGGGAAPGGNGNPALRADAPEDADKDGPADRKRKRKANLPQEYRSGAVPNESSDIEVRFQRAEDHLSRQEWAEGFSILDQMLAEITSPEHRRRLQRRAERRHRELERLLREREEKLEQGLEAGEEVLRRGGGGGRGRGAFEDVGDDVRAPTVEVYSQDGILYHPIPAAVRERLLVLPAEARELYVRTYEAPARKALEAAVERPLEQALKALRNVARRYPLTPSGRRAWEELASRLVDQGRAAEAAKTLEVRLRLPFDEGDAEETEVLSHAALTRFLGGHPVAGRRHLEKVATGHAETTVRVRGAAVLGAEIADDPFLTELAALAARRFPRPSAWSGVLGGPSHGPLDLPEDELPTLGSMTRWIFRLKDPAPSTTRTTSYVGPYPVLQLVTFDSGIYVRRGSELIALDAESGKLRWVADPGPRPPQAGSTRYYSSSANPDFYDLGGKTLTLIRGDPGGPPLVVMVDYTSGLRFERSGRPIYTPNRLLAYEATGGKLRWQLGGKGEETRRGPTRGLSFTAPPTAAGDFLVAPATRESGFYLVGASRLGTALWVRRLYSFSPLYYQSYGTLRQNNSLAVSEGVAYAAPGHGLVSAVEVASGELLWMTRYRGRPQRSYGVRWLNTHPLFVRGETSDVLLVAPIDSDYLTALDPETGALLWERRLDSRSTTSYGHQVLGTRDDAVYIFDGSVQALSLRSGRDLWESEEIGRAAGHGFVAANRIYVPASDGTVALLDAESGDVIQKVTVRDPRLGTRESINLFPAAGQLVALSPSRVFSLLPLEDSWTRLGKAEEATKGELLFERARLLRSEGRYREALDVLYRLLERYTSGNLRERLVKDLVAVVREAVTETEDPGFIQELLDRPEPLVKKRASLLYWRLWQADLFAKRERHRGILAFLGLLGNYGRSASSPEKNTVDVGVYASDVLREMRFGKRAPAGASGEEDLRPEPGQDLEDVPPAIQTRFQGEEDKVRAILESQPKLAALQRTVLRHSHAAAASEAAARLAVLAEAAGDRPEALAHLRLLQADYPSLGGVKAIAERIEQLQDQKAESGVLQGLAPPGSGEQKESPWRQAFWLPPEEGFLVEGAPGSTPLPFVLAIKGQRLVAYDIEGQPLFDRELPGYPDIEEAKLRLRSNVEEPAVAHLRDGKAVIFTAAGCYGFDCGEGPDLQPRAFKLAWLQGYPHGLEKFLQNRSRIIFGGGLPLPADMNAFPEVLFTAAGDTILLHPDSTLELIDRRTGKYIWRQSADVTAVGKPQVKGPWLTVLSGSPPGIIRYEIPRKGTERRGQTPEFYPGPIPPRITTAYYYRSLPGPTVKGWLVEGIAAVFQGPKIEVRSLAGFARNKGTSRLPHTLWTRNTASQVVLATPSTVWTSTYGNLKGRALRSGRIRQELELPERSRVAVVFEDPVADRGGITIVASSARTYSPVIYYGSSLSQTGDGLYLVHLQPENASGRLRKVWEKKICAGGIAYDGRRFLLEDGRWLLAYNGQELETEKWYTRIVAVDPESGESETWIEVEISGKGTGQPPRLCPSAGGLAVGNADGFGWYTRQPLPPDGDPEGEKNGREEPPAD